MTEEQASSSTEMAFADPSRSFTGHNAYYFNCDVVGHRPSYFVCLHKLKRREQGPLPDPHTACCAAIGSNQCDAKHMREKELLEGRSIFFVQRRQLEEMLPDRPRAPIAVSRPRPAPYVPPTFTAPRPVKVDPPVAKPTSAALDFASIVNELTAEPKRAETPPVPPKAAATAPTPSEPEKPLSDSPSLLEVARRLKKARESLTTD